MLAQALVQPLQIESEILDAAPPKLHVCVADPLGDDRRVSTGDLQHLGGHVDADDLARLSHHLRRDEADLACAAAQIEDSLTRPEIAAGIAAAVVPFDDLVRDDLQELRIVVHGTTEGRGLGLCGVGVAILDRGLLATGAGLLPLAVSLDHCSLLAGDDARRVLGPSGGHGIRIGNGGTGVAPQPASGFGGEPGSFG